jgi:outer membrane protein insertion porin family
MSKLTILKTGLTMPIQKEKIFNILLFLLAFFFSFTESPANQTNNTLQVEQIEISGNTKTRSGTILGFFDFTVGDQITKAQLDRGIQKINDSNFFKEVNVYTQPGTEKGNIVVFVEVKERHWPYFQVKGGYNELDGWYLSPIGLRFDNILGYGNYLGIEFFFGDRLIGLDIAYFRPQIFRSDVNLGILLYNRTRQYVHYLQDQRYLQEVRNGGIGVRLNANSGIMKYLWFDFVAESFNVAEDMWVSGDKDDRAPLPPVLASYVGENPTGRFVVSLNVDTRNQAFFPTRGWWGSLSLDQVNNQSDSLSYYSKIILDIRTYREIIRQWTLALRGKAAWIEDTAPFYDKFYLGGPNSLRGYEDRSLNPLGYASRLVQGSAELRIPLTRNNFPRHLLTGILFYDIGEAWNKPDEFDASRLKSSFGYGFRVRVPIIGLVRLDFAYPIPEYELRVHLSLGHTF